MKTFDFTQKKPIIDSYLYSNKDMQGHLSHLKVSLVASGQVLFKSVPEISSVNTP